MSSHNIGEAKSNLSHLIALAEAGEEVEIARNGVPVVRLVPIPQESVGTRFLKARGCLKTDFQFPEDFEFTEAELDEMLGA